MAVRAGVLPDRYADPREIGRGGMGEIIVADDTELGRKVAIKLLDERFSNRQDLRRRFRREALTAAKLSGDPHTITIYDVGEHNGRPFIVMEYLPGGSLADRARSGPVPPNQALEWLQQAAEALDTAHARGVVHRDVKPANLLFDAQDRLEVADFGIARANDDTTGMTAAGTVMGTAGYLAPEQARGEPATAASDRYALGVVAFELLTGGRPFERGSETAEAAAHIHERVPLASERGVGLPRSVDPVFERALAKDPAARYESASAFVTALAGSLAETTPTPTRILAPTAVPSSKQGNSRSRWLVPLAALALLAALGGGIAASVFAGSESDPRQRAAPPRPVTVTKRVVRTVAGENETVTKVVTTAAAPEVAPTQPGGDAAASSVSEAIALTDQSTDALRRGDWQEAERLARLAYPALAGTYSTSNPYEAYVAFDLGKALAGQGRCEAALKYLNRSESLQGPKDEISAAKEQCGG